MLLVVMSVHMLSGNIGLAFCTAKYLKGKLTSVQNVINLHLNQITMPQPLLPILVQHHCRRCGRVCCASCCDTRMELPRMCFLDPVRLCSACANTTLKEKIFFNQDIKDLMAGKCTTMPYLIWLP